VTAAVGRPTGPGGPGPVGPQTYIRPPLSRPEKYERMAFTFCRMGTVGLIAWALSPAIFVLVVALVAIVLYARSITLGVSWSKCFLRRPTLIIAAWTAIAAADAAWLFILGGRLPS
jgi:hypothetical protein